MRSVKHPAGCQGVRTGRRRSYAGGASIVVGAWALYLVPGMTTAAPPMVDRPLVDLQTRANDAANVLESEIINLDLPATLEAGFAIDVPLLGEERTIVLNPNSIRTADFRLLVQQEDGSVVEQAPEAPKTVRGSVIGFDGSLVQGSLLESGLWVMVRLQDGTRFGIQPLDIDGAEFGDHLVYNAEDVIASGGVCGVKHDDQMPDIVDGDIFDGGIAGAGTYHCTEIGVDCDWEFYNDWGANVTSVADRAEAVLAAMDTQYEMQVDITHVISAIIVRSTSNDPYTSSDASTLLNQFAAEWNSNQGGIARDVAHLFTGRNISGGTIGIASLGTICNVGSAYGLVQSDCCSPNFICATDLSAHELGHNWSAGHCSCPSNTMNPTIACSNNFSAGTITQITNFRNSRNCLDDCSGEDAVTTLPFFDDFPDNTIDPALWSENIKVTAETAGSQEPSLPFSMRVNGRDEIRTAIIDLSDAANVVLSYWWQRTGTGNSPETGDDLFVEYRDVNLNWITLQQHLGSGSDGLPFNFVQMDLPAGAYHEEFRLRFRNDSTQDNLDDFFVDDVSITGVVAPINDDCDMATLTFDASNPFTTIGADTDGPVEGCADLSNDVWYRYINSTCFDTIVFSVCDADYDATIAVYDVSCPTGPGELIACSDDSCGTGPSVSIPGTNTLYRVRIGGNNGETGSGTLTIGCEMDNDCPSDFDGSGSVDAGDLLALLGAWGTDGDGADLAEPTNVVDASDLLVFLSMWGACP